MKTYRPFALIIVLLGFTVSSNAQSPAVLKGKKIAVNVVDGKFGPFQGNLGYTYSIGMEGKCNLELAPGIHTIEFAPWWADRGQYKLVFTSEEGKTYEITKDKNNDDRPQLIDADTEEPAKDARITVARHIPANKEDEVVHLYEGTKDKSELAVLTLAPEFYDIIPIVFKIDDIWGPVTGVMWRYNNFKIGDDFWGATKAMTFSVELLPGEHTMDYCLHSNKVKFTSDGGLTVGFKSLQVYPLKFNVEAGKTYTFKYRDASDPSSLFIEEKTE